MADNNDQHVFFVDDELVERLMRGDKVEDPDSKKTRPAAVSALAKAISLATEGRLDDAIKELERAAENGEIPSRSIPRWDICASSSRIGATAAECYGKVAALEPKHRTAHYNLGLCLERQDKFDEAAQSFETALEIDPQRWQAQLATGPLPAATGQAEEAHGVLRSQPQGEPQSRSGPVRKSGGAPSARAIWTARAEIYRKLLPSNPNSPELLVNLISLSSARKEEGKMKEFAERLLKIRPQSRQGLQGLAAAALMRGDYSAAVKNCTSLGESGSGLLRGLVQPRRRLSENGAPGAGSESPIARPLESARTPWKPWRISASCCRSAATSPAHGTPMNTFCLARPICLARYGIWRWLPNGTARPSEAEPYFEKLVALQPDFEDAAFRLGYLQLQRAEYAGAVDSFETCLKTREDWVEALLNLGLACWKFEDLDAATRNL